MRASPARPRLNIYLEDVALEEKIKIAAVRQRVSLSAYCVEAIRRRLAEEELQSGAEPERGSVAAARSLDRLRRQIGPIGVPVSELIADGRRR